MIGDFNNRSKLILFCVKNVFNIMYCYMSNTVLTHEKASWSEEHDMILVTWADKAMCYKWLHSKAHLQYSSYNAWFTIPVIILSTITGTANFAQDRVPLKSKGMFVMVVGALNILVGVISTIQQFLKITQLCEAHRVSEIAWGKFYRNIVVELAKHPGERVDPIHMIKVCKEEYDRLIETSPYVPGKIIKRFTIKFQNLEVYSLISKPEICGELVPTASKRNRWNEEESEIELFDNNIKSTLRKRIIMQNNIEFQRNMVTHYVTIFNEINGHKPTPEEIVNNLKDRLHPDIINEIITSSNCLAPQLSSISSDSNQTLNVNLVSVNNDVTNV